jgi:hypothetical protein
MSASSAAWAVWCRGSDSSSSRDQVITNGETQAVGLRQLQRALNGRVRGAMVTEVLMSQPGQQLSLQDSRVANDRRGTLEDLIYRAKGRARVAFR